MVLTSIALLMQCAAEAAASGGPEDTESPKIVAVNPAGSTSDLAPDTRIIVRFTEPLDPLSVPAAVTITPGVPVNIKTRRNTITIDPVDSWPVNQLIRIQLTRTIRDYRKNELEAPLQLVYSTGAEVPSGQISGRLFALSPKSIAQVALYSYPVKDSAQTIDVIEAGSDGKFMFDHIADGTYCITALEGTIQEFGLDYRKKRYGLFNQPVTITDSLQVRKNVYILMDDALQRVSITSADFLQSTYCTLNLSDNTTLPYIIPSYHTSVEPGDTLSIELDLRNRLEEYRTHPYICLLPEIPDTIPPSIASHAFDDYRYIISFSEPMMSRLDPRYSRPFFLEGVKDSVSSQYLTYWKDEFSLSISDIETGTESILLPGSGFSDLAGLHPVDSIQVLDINWNTYPRRMRTGDITGSILYPPFENTIVEAVNLETGRKYHTDVVDGRYEFSRLEPGYYKVWAYERLRNEDIYFSGIWRPLEFSAKFAVYPEPVEVRVRWVIEGIDIDFSGMPRDITVQKEES